MYSKIIIGHDGSERGDDALALGRAFAQAEGGEALVVRVVPADMVALGGRVGWTQSLRDMTLNLLADACKDDPNLRPELIEDHSPGRGLHHLAAHEEADLIVVGSSRQGGVGRIIPGSTAAAVLHGAPCAVAVAPVGYYEHHRGGVAFEHIGVGYDGNTEADAALGRAVELARATGAALRLTAFVAPPEVPLEGKGRHAEGVAELAAAIDEQMRARLEHGVASVPDDVDAEGEVVEGDVASLAAGEQPDLIVLGSRGYGPLSSALMGSVSARVVRNARCPVLVCPRDAVEDTTARPGHEDARAVRA